MKIRQARKVLQRYNAVLSALSYGGTLLAANSRYIARCARSRFSTIRRAHRRYGYGEDLS